MLRYWIEALFEKVSNAKRLLAPDPVMLPDKRSNALFTGKCSQYWWPTGQSRPVQQVSDPDPHVMKRAIWKARGNSESENSVY